MSIRQDFFLEHIKCDERILKTDLGSESNMENSTAFFVHVISVRRSLVN